MSNSSFFLPYFNLYVYDITNSVRVRMMTSAERSAYFMLLCEAWKQPDCGLPIDDATLSVLSLAGSEWEVTSKSVRAMFKVRGDRMYNDRLLHERKKLVSIRGGNRKGGMKSGNTRRKKKLNNEVTSKSLQSDYEDTGKYTETETETETDIDHGNVVKQGSNNDPPTHPALQHDPICIKNLRKNIPMATVLDALEVYGKAIEGTYRFRCPLCYGMDTQIHTKTNKAYCFECPQTKGRDGKMHPKSWDVFGIVAEVKRLTFLEAVNYVSGFQKVNDVIQGIAGRMTPGRH